MIKQKKKIHPPPPSRSIKPPPPPSTTLQQKTRKLPPKFNTDIGYLKKRAAEMKKNDKNNKSTWNSSSSIKGYKRGQNYNDGTRMDKGSTYGRGGGNKTKKNKRKKRNTTRNKKRHKKKKHTKRYKKKHNKKRNNKYSSNS